MVGLGSWPGHTCVSDHHEPIATTYYSTKSDFAVIPLSAGHHSSYEKLSSWLLRHSCRMLRPRVNQAMTLRFAFLRSSSHDL